MSERYLEDTLEKLDIIPEASKSSKYPKNPFAIVPSVIPNQDEMLKKLFGNKCQKCAENSKLSIIHPTHFKAKSRTTKKFIKESKLKNIGKCIHNIIRKDTSGSCIESNSSSTNQLDNKEQAKSFGSDFDQVLDFRLLVNRYNELSLTSPLSASSSSTSLDDDQEDFSRKCFTTLRPHLMPNRLKTSKSNEALNLNPRQPASSSCSQQARISPNSLPSDDITADEIASYFETMVYIPKKMSTMAEMMYI